LTGWPVEGRIDASVEPERHVVRRRPEMGQMERAKQLASKRLLAMKLKQAEKEARRKAIRDRAPFK
jgi:hypothetical protein